MSEIIEGVVEKMGFMSYGLKRDSEIMPLYSHNGNVFGTTTPSWNTFAGLAKDGRKVKLEGFFERTLTLKGMKNVFIAVRYVA